MRACDCDSLITKNEQKTKALPFVLAFILLVIVTYWLDPFCSDYFEWTQNIDMQIINFEQHCQKDIEQIPQYHMAIKILRTYLS